MEKRYLYLYEAEWRRLVFYLNEFRNKLIVQGRYTDCADELLVKTVNAKIEKIRRWEYYDGKVSF